MTRARKAPYDSPNSAHRLVRPTLLLRTCSTSRLMRRGQHESSDLDVEPKAILVVGTATGLKFGNLSESTLLRTMHPSDHPKKALAPILVKLAHASAPLLSTFLLIHLSAPLLANVGGSNLSSGVMLLGREYYQTPFGEKYLVLTPFVIHVASGIALRLLSPHSKRPRKLTSTLSLTAYAALLFVPVHVFIHRLAPANPSPPILAVGPAELDYEFVKTGLSQFPWRNWALYAGLVGSVLMHAVEGVNVLRTTWLGAARLSSRTRKVIASAAALPVMMGLWTLSREPLMALSSTVERYGMCFTLSWVYRV